MHRGINDTAFRFWLSYGRGGLLCCCPGGLAQCPPLTNCSIDIGTGSMYHFHSKCKALPTSSCWQHVHLSLRRRILVTCSSKPRQNSGQFRGVGWGYPGPTASRRLLRWCGQSWESETPVFIQNPPPLCALLVQSPLQAFVVLIWAKPWLMWWIGAAVRIKRCTLVARQSSDIRCS